MSLHRVRSGPHAGTVIRKSARSMSGADQPYQDGPRQMYRHGALRSLTVSGVLGWWSWPLAGLYLLTGHVVARQVAVRRCRPRIWDEPACAPRSAATAVPDARSS